MKIRAFWDILPCSRRQSSSWSPHENLIYHKVLFWSLTCLCPYTLFQLWKKLNIFLKILISQFSNIHIIWLLPEGTSLEMTHIVSDVASSEVKFYIFPKETSLLLNYDNLQLNMCTTEPHHLCRPNTPFFVLKLITVSIWHSLNAKLACKGKNMFIRHTVFHAVVYLSI
jgi:hypothetical protein